MAEILDNSFIAVERPHAIAPVLAKTAIIFYLFFAFFGTTLPFQEQATAAEDIVTSNWVNQVVYTLLYLLAAASLIGRWNDVLSFLKREKMFFLFAVWCGATIMWSYEPMISLKRWIQMAGGYLIFTSVILLAEAESMVLKYLKAILMPYTVLTLAAILVVPEAVHEDGVWRGLAPHKNILGQTALMGMIVWSHALLSPGGLSQKVLAGLFWVLSAVLVAGSHSATSALTFVLLTGIWVLHQMDLKILRPKIGPAYSRLIIGFGMTAVLLLVLLNMQLFELILGAVGRDITLTERVDLWAIILEEVRKHWVLGCGFGGYWVPTSALMTAIYEDFVWLPNQAHNGYLDILNETGIIGLTLFLGLVLYYLKRLKTHSEEFFWKWIFLAVLVLNFTESMFIRVHEPTAAMFFLSYLAGFGIGAGGQRGG